MFLLFTVVAGADVNKQDREGYNILHLCSIRNKVAVAMRLLQTPGCDVNLISNSGRTALMEAIENRHVEIVKMLVEAGCCLEIPDRNGRTPLIAAVQADQNEALAMMLQHSANTDKVGQNLSRAYNI